MDSAVQEEPRAHQVIGQSTTQARWASQHVYYMHRVPCTSYSTVILTTISNKLYTGINPQNNIIIIYNTLVNITIIITRLNNYHWIYIVCIITPVALTSMLTTPTSIIYIMYTSTINIKTLIHSLKYHNRSQQCCHLWGESGTQSTAPTDLKATNGDKNWWSQPKYYRF